MPYSKYSSKSRLLRPFICTGLLTDRTQCSGRVINGSLIIMSFHELDVAYACPLVFLFTAVPNTTRCNYKNHRADINVWSWDGILHLSVAMRHYWAPQCGRHGMGIGRRRWLGYRTCFLQQPRGSAHDDTVSSSE